MDTACASGFLPLHAAAAADQHGALRALIAAGADVDARSTDGLSALELACACGHAESVALLLEAGATLGGALACAAVSGEDAVVRALDAHPAADTDAILGTMTRLHG